jgi:hypothetical protein
LTSFTINAGIMTNGLTYTVQADYKQIENINTNTFTGTGISTNFLGVAQYTTSTYITVLAQTPMLTSTLVGNQVIISWSPATTGWTLPDEQQSRHGHLGLLPRPGRQQQRDQFAAGGKPLLPSNASIANEQGRPTVRR